MARDATPYARPAVLTLLKAAAPLALVVPSERIFPQQRPALPEWPFVAMGMPLTVPLVATRLDGSVVSFAMHVYAETRNTDEATISGFDEATEILAVIVGILGGEEGAEIALERAPFPATASIQWTGSQIIQDGPDPNAFHGFANFDMTVSS